MKHSEHVCSSGYFLIDFWSVLSGLIPGFTPRKIILISCNCLLNCIGLNIILIFAGGHLKLKTWPFALHAASIRVKTTECRAAPSKRHAASVVKTWAPERRGTQQSTFAACAITVTLLWAISKSTWWSTMANTLLNAGIAIRGSTVKRLVRNMKWLNTKTNLLWFARNAIRRTTAKRIWGFTWKLIFPTSKTTVSSATSAGKLSNRPKASGVTRWPTTRGDSTAATSVIRNLKVWTP